MVGTTTRCSWQRTSNQIEIQTSPDKGRTAAPKVGRNDLCPRGSGKKIQALLRRGDGELNLEPEKTLSIFRMIASAH